MMGSYVTGGRGYPELAPEAPAPEAPAPAPVTLGAVLVPIGVGAALGVAQVPWWAALAAGVVVNVAQARTGVAAPGGTFLSWLVAKTASKALL